MRNVYSGIWLFGGRDCAYERSEWAKGIDFLNFIAQSPHNKKKCFFIFGSETIEHHILWAKKAEKVIHFIIFYDFLSFLFLKISMFVHLNYSSLETSRSILMMYV